jgi:gas vesicle protein
VQFLLGLVIGIAIGLLAAPKRGAELRDTVRQGVGTLQTKAAQPGAVGDAVRQVSDVASKAVTRATGAAQQAATDTDAGAAGPSAAG